MAITRSISFTDDIMQRMQSVVEEGRAKNVNNLVNKAVRAYIAIDVEDYLKYPTIAERHAEGEQMIKSSWSQFKKTTEEK